MNRNRPRKLTASQRRNVAQIVAAQYGETDRDTVRALTTYTARTIYRADV